MTSGRALDLTGEKYCKLVPIKRVESIGGNTAWECKCLCGNLTVVTTTHLRRGVVKSCGCLAPKSSFLKGITKLPPPTNLKRYEGIPLKDRKF